MPLFGSRVVVGTANYKHVEEFKKETEKRETALGEWRKEKTQRWERVRSLKRGEIPPKRRSSVATTASTYLPSSNPSISNRNIESHQSGYSTRRSSVDLISFSSSASTAKADGVYSEESKRSNSSSRRGSKIFSKKFRSMSVAEPQDARRKSLMSLEDGVFKEEGAKISESGNKMSSQDLDEEILNLTAKIDKVFSEVLTNFCNLGHPNAQAWAKETHLGISFLREKF